MKVLIQIIHHPPAMKISGIPHIMTFIFILVIALFYSHSQFTDAAVGDSSSQRRPYIVHVEQIPSTNLTMSHQQWHKSFLPSTSSQGLMFSYKHVMSGFAAMLTEEEVEAVSQKDGFLHAHPSENYKLATTHSPSFLGLTNPSVGSNHSKIWKEKFGYGKGVIIGVLDSGFLPNHPSFNDQGMPPAPAKWKGKCQGPIVCNNKIIGAKSFVFDLDGSLRLWETPVDEDGHGTHTASTAAGQFVDNASVLGSAQGVASGIAPGAHLAIYKVCGSSSYCSGVSILAGMESAMRDGVDVISISLGSAEGALYMNPISIASFKLVNDKGIFVSASAGNEGPESSTLGNVSPWIFTVGASTIDRKILAVVKLSNGLMFQGESAYQPKNFTSSPLVYPQSKKDENSTYCSNVTTLKTIGVAGKVVVCNAGIVDRVQKGLNVKEAGGVAMIIIGSTDDGFATYAVVDAIPTSGLIYKDGQKILNHYYKNPNITATIEFLGTQIGGGRGDNPAPAVAAFSSRGPSKVTSGFIKPDGIGPGVNILAAWVDPVGIFNVSPPFNIVSGTSMSCPHLSGVAALLKRAHPDWSPAMIKSAIITTSDLTNKDGKRIIDQYDNLPANFHAMGSGHVNLIKADNPGLVYDIRSKKDYVAYLCGLNYTDRQVSIFVPHSKCKNTVDGIDLNYPSMIVELTRSNHYHRRFSRVVTNVGPNLKYNVNAMPPPGVIVDVEPKTLMFKSIGNNLKFTVDVRWDAESPEYSSFSEGFGYFSWVSSDGKIKVRSPMVITKERKK